MLRRTLWLKIMSLVLIGAFSSQVFAQAAQEKSGPLEAREVVGNVLLAGLVGGILGLSTLSFYSEPQEHIRNITIGAGAGMIISVLYLASQAASVDLKLDEKEGTTAMVFPVIQPDSVHVAASLRF